MLAQISSYWGRLSKAERAVAGVAVGALLSMLERSARSNTRRAAWRSRAIDVVPSERHLGGHLLRSAHRAADRDLRALAYNFYLVEPRYTFGFAGYEDAFTLLVFITVAVLIGGLAGNLHDQRERAREQVRVLSGLFTVSRSMAECTSEREALERLPPARAKSLPRTRLSMARTALALAHRRRPIPATFSRCPGNAKS